MRSDLRSAWRAMWVNPLSTLSAILALALGICATTTVFGLVNAVMLRPLPYPEADRLVEIWGTVQRQTIERRGASYPDYFDWRDQTQTFDGMASWSDGASLAYGPGEPIQVTTEVVDGPYLELLGASPILGRVFDRSDHQIGAAPVAVISETLWGERFNRAPDVNGRALQLGRTVFTIIGVVPARFRGRSDQALIWTPAATTLPRDVLAARGSRGFGIVARLKAGVSRQAAQDEIHVVSARLARDYSATNEARSAEVVGLADEMFRDIRPAVRLLFGIALAVLLMACANVASLLLARGEERQNEISMRRALGSSDRRVMQLLLIESAMLVVMGLGAGWLVARWMGEALLALSPVQLPSFARPETDWRTMAFLATVGVCTTIVFGLMPLRSSRGGALAQWLREAAATGRGGNHGSALRVILMAQVTVAVVLLVSAALLSRSFVALLTFDPGFEPEGVLSIRVQLPSVPAPPDGAPSGSPRAGAGALALLEQVRGLPGVSQASLTTSVPLVNASAIFFAAENMPPVDATNRPRAYIHQIAPGYFATLGMRILDGRDFAPSDMNPESTAVIVSENVARRFWPGERAVGRRITPGNAGPKAEWLTIVGVVEEANLRGIPRNPTADPDIFIRLNARATSFAVMLRTAGDPAALASPVRALVSRLEPGAAVFAERTLASLVDQELAQARFLSWLTGTFAALALTLAAIGIYGTFSYWVRRRRTEIGIRSALGAGQWRLVRLVVGQAVGVAAIGVLAGAAVAAGLSRYLEAQLFGVQRTDWASFAGTAILVISAAFLASLLPAARAARIDPARTLRSNG